jgi:hypothetical protein
LYQKIHWKIRSLNVSVGNFASLNREMLNAISFWFFRTLECDTLVQLLLEILELSSK